MDFFEHQDRARRKTGRLVGLFGAAVLAIILLVYVLAALIMPLVGGVHETGRALESDSVNLDEAWRWRWWDPALLGIVTLGVGTVVGLGSLYKIAQLRGGGSVVATELGGRPVPPDTTDPNERRVLNVVEEMAIASGIAAPPVYLLDRERGINAFAAGYSPRDAVIGVTRGTVEVMSRDELQGVMAHEFSHILNGDMRLNIRLIGVLNGILVLGLLGRFLMRSSFYTRSSSRDRADGVIYLAALGAGLAAIGAIGMFFGSLIKASVSRQREYLADASAVQFTRNPEGIAGALKKIGGLRFGSTILNPNAPEASHMFFASGLSSAFATHPPLRDRIRRIDASWDGTYPTVSIEPDAAPATRGARRVAPGMAALADEPAPTPQTPEAPRSGLDEIGTLTRTSIAYAAALVRAIPEPIASAARDAFSARAVVLAMLMDRDAGVRARQLEMLRETNDGIADEAERLWPGVASLDQRLRLPLVDITLGTLKGMTRPQYETFRTRVERMIAADAKRDLFEWVLLRIFRRHLDGHYFGAAPTRVAYYGLQRLTDQCRVLLSTLAYAGSDDPVDAARAYAAGASRLGVEIGGIAEPGDCGLRALGAALDELDRVSAKLKRSVLTACAACIAADREVTAREGELLRAICDDLGCPMPPLLPGQALL